MKLSKLYSNDSRFKTVYFSNGLNLVLGKVSDTDNLNRDSHNLGKSRLIELIDFMLLKKLKKGNFLKHQEFINHIFFLEIQLNSGTFLTIKRAVNQNTKISFKFSDRQYGNFVNEINWDYKDLALSSKNDDINPKKILNKILGFNVLPNWSYRDYLNYFLRTQNDYSDEFHLSKYSGSDSGWKPLLYELLGFSSKAMIEKYQIDSEITDINKEIKICEAEFKINSENIDKIKGLISINEAKKEEIQSSLEKFDFRLIEKNINFDLVDDIEKKISKKNTKRYNLQLEIDSLYESIQENVTFDLDATLNIFNEVKIYFSDQLKKSYADLIEFNSQITGERNKHIKETVSQKKLELACIEENLSELNQEREKLLSTLVETDLFKKYKSLERMLIKIERNLEQYSLQLSMISNIDQLEEKKSLIIAELSEKIKIIRTQIEESNNLYTKIRQDFSSYVYEVLGQTGFLYLSQNTNGNIEFSTEIINAVNEATAQGDGHSYKKLLCACFDLALLVNYSSQSFIKFICHDGCLETLDRRKQRKYLHLVQRLCAQHNIQYILTLIESDLPQDIDEKNALLETTNIAVELSDINSTTNLFGFSF